MIDILSIVLLIFGVLQIILFFKVWGMTNDVKKMKERLEKDQSNEDSIIIEAQSKVLEGDKEKAYKLYQKAFYLSIVDLYNKTVDAYGDEDRDNYDRDTYYENQFTLIDNYYSKRINKINMSMDTVRFNSFKKTNTLISKL